MIDAALAIAIALLATPLLDFPDLENQNTPAEGKERLPQNTAKPCPLGGDATEGIGAAYWGGVGSFQRHAQARLTASVGPHATAAHRVDLAYSHAFVSILETVFRLETGQALTHSANRFAIPTFSLGGQYRSPCDAFAVEMGARLLLPSKQPTADEARDAFDAALVDGPANDALWLPLSEVGGQFYARARIRERTPHLAAGMEFGVRLGRAKAASWLGPQEGVVGGMWLEGFLFRAKWAGLKLGIRGEMGLSSLWPANEVIPLRATGTLGVSPAHAFSLEVGGGVVSSPQSATDLKQPHPIFTASVTFYPF